MWLPFTTPDRRSDPPPTDPEGGDEEAMEEEREERSQSCCSASSGVILKEGSHLEETGRMNVGCAGRLWGLVRMGLAMEESQDQSLEDQGEKVLQSDTKHMKERKKGMSCRSLFLFL